MTVNIPHFSQRFFIIALASMVAVSSGCSEKTSSEGVGEAFGSLEIGEAHAASVDTDGNPGERDIGGDHRGDQGTSEVKLTPKQVKLSEIRSTVVTSSTIDIELALPGEVSVNQNRLAHIVPKVSGVVQRVRKTVGDRVRAGEVLAIIESRELAELKATFLANRERVALAEANFAREAELRKKKITAEQEYLSAKQALAETRIELYSAEQRLKVLSYSDEDLQKIAGQPDQDLTRYEVTAPFAGTIIASHITQGELVGDAILYSICDLNAVWVMGSVYEKDIARVKLGQRGVVAVQATYGDRTFVGKVTWISDLIDEETRTMKIRVEVPNTERLLKPGMFARLTLAVHSKPDALTVSPAAVQKDGDDFIVFVDQGQGRYERRVVAVGLRSRDRIELLSGVRRGEKVVHSGSFILKSEILKEGFEAD